MHLNLREVKILCDKKNELTGPWKEYAIAALRLGISIIQKGASMSGTGLSKEDLPSLKHRLAELGGNDGREEGIDQLYDAFDSATGRLRQALGAQRVDFDSSVACVPANVWNLYSQPREAKRA
jgi:hypothetical protein